MVQKVSPLYQSEPLSWSDAIPVFSAADSYNENYAKIAQDHLEAAEKQGIDNPFISDALWRELEDSTKLLVDKYIPAHSRVLDVGVGLGRVLESYTQLERYGIDISLDYMAIAQRKGIEVAYARIEDMPYHDEVFDAALSCDVLEHVIDLHACCMQIVRVVKKGGTIIIRVPQGEDMNAYLTPSIPYQFVHLRRFDVASLRLLFEKLYGCEYIEHQFVAPTFTGAHTLAIRTLEAADPFRETFKQLANGENQTKELSQRIWGKRTPEQRSDVFWKIIRHMTVYTQEDIHNNLGIIRDEYPELYAQIRPHLVQPLEVNVVFRKKTSPVMT
ncbi:MAG: class I SAM-dependent methyltransferase [Rickettsiales bacterium]